MINKPTLLKQYFLLLILLFFSNYSFSQGQDYSSKYKNTIIKAKGDSHFAPFEYINEKGEPDGFNVELFKYLMDRLGFEYELKLENWSKVRKELSEEKIDLLIGLAYSENRDKGVRFCVPHCIINYNIICRNTNVFKNIESLKDKKIIVQKDDRAYDYIIENNITKDIIAVDNMEDGLKFLSKGIGDAAISFDMIAYHLIYKNKYKNILYFKSDIPSDSYSIALKNNDNDELLYLLNTELYNMKVNGAYDKLYYKWFNVYEESYTYKNVKYILITLSVSISILIFFIWLLRLRVSKATKDLETKNKEALSLVEELRHENLKRIEIEKNLINAKEKAEESDKLKSAFVANMSHEIRTPLNAIVGFAEILNEIEDPNERINLNLIIKKNSEHLLQLVDDILDLSRIESNSITLKFSNFDLFDLCQQTLISVSSSVHRDNKVNLSLNMEYNCILFNDKTRVSQIITNFLNNAIKFTPKGDIVLATRKLDNDKIEISVTDTGIGIKEEDKNSIFERFVKINSFSQGSGLGLSICKSIIEKLNGEIGVESTFGNGSKFWIILPEKINQSSINNSNLNSSKITIND